MKKILFSGGGTLGPVIPLISLIKYIHNNNENHKIYWIGTYKGIEKDFLENEDVVYRGIITAKLRRYFDWRNFLIPFQLFIGILQSIYYISKWKIDVIFSAGAFTAVPVSIAGWLLRKRIIIHQQDVEISLSNKIIAYFADIVTVSLPHHQQYFEKKGLKVYLTGNPVREEIKKVKKMPREKIISNINNRTLKEKIKNNNLPILLITGGGTGARQINELVLSVLQDLIERFFIIHVTGKGRFRNQPDMKNYICFENIKEEYPYLLALADIVISRAGMSSLTEFAYLGKPVILIPMPDSHQERNSEYFAKKDAVIELKIKNIDQESRSLFKNTLFDLATDTDKKKQLSENISSILSPNACENITKIIL